MQHQTPAATRDFYNPADSGESSALKESPLPAHTAPGLQSLVGQEAFLQQVQAQKSILDLGEPGLMQLPETWQTSSPQAEMQSPQGTGR